MTEKKKYVVLGILAAIIVIIAALFVIRELRGNTKLVKYRENNLTEQERQVVQKRLEDAQAAIQNLKPDSETKEKVNAYMQAGFQEYALGELAKARDYYNQAQKADPHNANVYGALAQVSLDMGDITAAQTAIAKATEIDPHNPDWWKRYIDLKKDFLHANNLELIQLYKAALQQSNNNINMVKYYAIFLTEIGDKGQAIEYWKKAAEIDPDHAQDYQVEINRL